MATDTAHKVRANGVVYDLVDSAARAGITAALAEVEKATARVEAIAPLNYPLVYSPTSDTTRQPGKFYYTYAGDGRYSQYSGAFVEGTTYYEIDQSIDKMPQVKVDSTMTAEMASSWDTKKFVSGASVAIGHHARALPENDNFNWNIAIGQNATAGDGDAGDQCCAIGEQAVASKYSCTAIGSKTQAIAYGATGIGYGSVARAVYSIVIGKNSYTSDQATGSLMLGPGTNTEPGTVYVGVTDVIYTEVPTASHTTFKHGTSYFTRSGSGTTADPYKYSKYNGTIGEAIPSDPQIYIMGEANSKTYKLLSKEGIIPGARLQSVNAISVTPAATMNITPTINCSNLILPASGSFATNAKFNIKIDPSCTDFSTELMFASSCSNIQFAFVAKTGKTDIIKYVGSTQKLTTTTAGIVSIRSIEVDTTRYIIVKIEV